MKHTDLLAKITSAGDTSVYMILRAVVELHKPIIHKGYENQGLFCANCEFDYPCPTIQAIEKELG